MTLFLRVACWVFVISLSRAELLFDVQPSVISPEITRELVINCSITNNQVQHLDVIKSLTLSRYNQTSREFDDMVALETLTLYLKQLEEFQYSQISFGNVYIALTLHNPTQSDARVYRCIVDGENVKGENISSYSKKTVELEANSTALIEEIRRYKKEDNSCKCFIDYASKYQRSRLHFSGNSEVIKERIEPLTLKCTYQNLKDDKNETLTLQSLYILHETNGVIAKINKGEPASSTIQESNFRNVKGEINDNELIESYLQIEWSNVKFSESGKYFCEAHTKQSEGRSDRLKKMLTITVLNPTFDDLVKVVEKLTTQVYEDRQEVEVNKQNIKYMREDLNAQEQNISIFKDKVEIMLANVSTALTEVQNLADKGTTDDKLLTDRVSFEPTTSCHNINITEDRVIVKLISGLKVMCDTKTDGGGWIIFQRRINGKVDFYKGWKHYRDGFGDYDIGEFYLGNENIFKLTSTGQFDLRIDLEFNNKTYFAQYEDFKVLSETEKYKLQIGQYSGNSSDNLSYHNNMFFTTFDRDNDMDSENCAKKYKGAWWYKACHESNLNGIWESKFIGQGLQWINLTSFFKSITFTEMKIRERLK